MGSQIRKQHFISGQPIHHLLNKLILQEKFSLTKQQNNNRTSNVCCIDGKI